MISILIGLIVGLLLGLTGAGGSIFAVPLLMAGLGWPITQAATASLLTVAVAAMVGTGMAWRHSYVRYRAATLLGVMGILLAPIGIRVADALQPSVLVMAFALILAIVAVRMFREAMISKEDTAVVRSAVSGEGNPSVGKIGSIDPHTGRLVWTRPVAFTIALIGATTGFLSGLLGVGGGFVIVPALRATMPLSMHSAVATSMMAISIISFGAFVSGLLQGRSVPLMTVAPFIGGAILGMVLGRRLAPLISGPHLQQGFALMALLVSIILAVHSLSLA